MTRDIKSKSEFAYNLSEEDRIILTLLLLFKLALTTEIFEHCTGIIQGEYIYIYVCMSVYIDAPTAVSMLPCLSLYQVDTHKILPN